MIVAALDLVATHDAFPFSLVVVHHSVKYGLCQK